MPSPETAGTIVKAVTENPAAAGAIGTVIATIIVAIARYLKPPTKPETPQRTHPDDLQKLFDVLRPLANPRVTSRQPTEFNADDLRSVVERLSKMREEFAPPKLSPGSFPREVRVRFYDDSRFKIHVCGMHQMRATFGVFTAFPAAFVALILYRLTSSALLGVATATAVWLWRNLFCFYISIDLAEKKCRVTYPLGWEPRDHLPLVHLSVESSAHEHVTSVCLGAFDIVRRKNKAPERFADLEQLVSVLKWHFGEPIEVAPGVHISQ